MPTEIRVPTLGESVTEATVARWLKQPGEAVARDEPVVELETDKVTLEVPAPVAGTLGEINAAEGTNVPVGAILATIAGSIAARALTAPLPARGRVVASPRRASPLPARGERDRVRGPPRSTGRDRPSASWWPRAASTSLP
jgi:2-oxoglutarate dehydrogenase E2 component (dihydrolipoamide succinyltransferase)